MPQSKELIAPRLVLIMVLFIRGYYYKETETDGASQAATTDTFHVTNKAWNWQGCLYFNIL